MIVDHLASPAVAGFSVSKIWGQGPGSWVEEDRTVTRSGMLSDAMWARIEPLLPSSNGKRGGRWTDHRTVVEGIAWRFRAGTPWRDVPDDFGSWKTLWKRHDRWSGDGTWDRLLTEMCADADAVAELDWLVAVDSSINRAHQHAAGARRITDPTAIDTESVESVESPTAAQTHAGGDTGGGVD